MEFNLNNIDLNEAVRELNERVTKLEHSISTPAPDNYMVTVEDLMARIKSRDDRIEALKKDIDMYIDEKNDLYLSNIKLNEQCHKFENEFGRLNEEITALNKEKDLLVKALNIYQKYTIIEVFPDGVTIFTLNNPDGIGRIIVNDPEVVKTMTDAWLKYGIHMHVYSKKEPKKKIGETRCCDYNCCKSCPLSMANCCCDEEGTLYEILDKTFENDGVDKDNPIYKAFRAELDKEVE